MANFIGAIEQFNPYIQQIPTEAYTKVGMFKEQQYQAGVQKVQDTVDKVAGLDIANEGGRNYLKARVSELTGALNKYSHVDFSNPDNVSQLSSLAKPLYQDENIVNDVINTGVYRKWNKEAGEAFKSGKMELGQYARENSDASQWLTSQSAGSKYTGRSTPNLATRKDLLDRIVKAKKDAFDKNEYVYDINYSKDTPYYVKSTNKYYNEADFNNFVTDALMSSKDREMLMNEHWFENQGVPTETLQKEDILMYQSKIQANNKRIQEIQNDPLLYSGDKKTESQKVIDDLRTYNDQLKKGKIKFLQELNLADPTSRDVFHRDIAESRFVNSLDILRDEVRKEELVKNEQWFKDKELEIELSKEAAKARAAGTTTGKQKKENVEEQIGEVAVYTPVDANSPKTQLSLNTIQRGWNIKNDEITNSMNGLIGKLQENGVDMSQFIAGWDQVQIGTKAGASMNVPRFKDQASKDRFYNMVAGLNFAYTKEAQDGHMDNKSFSTWIKNAFTDYKDEDPNSKFTLGDKIVSDALNTLKGTTALLPRLEKLFADKGVVKSLAQIDSAIKDKKDMANAYREALLKTPNVSESERNVIINLSDEEVINPTFILNKEMEKKRHKDKQVAYRIKKESNGTYSIYQRVFDKNTDVATAQYAEPDVPMKDSDEIAETKSSLENRRIATGYKSLSAAMSDYQAEGAIGNVPGVSKETFTKAEEYVKQTYSYVQENLNSTVQNLKNNKDDYEAVKDAVNIFITRGKGVVAPQDLQIDGVADPSVITGISDIEIKGATISNTEDIFNPNPMYEVSFKAYVPDEKGDRKEVKLDAKVSLRSFLATNPNYKTTEYAKYFAPALYGQKDAYARIKAKVNPLEGSEASYNNRKNIEPVFNRINQQGESQYAYDDPSEGKQYGNEYQWETIPIEKEGKQTMVSYQVVSLGENTTLGNIKNKDGNEYAPGAFYIKLKIPTSTGKPKVIFLKKPNGDSFSFNSASNAHYTVRDLIFNNPDIKLDEVTDKGEINYFTVDPSTIRGIFNSQLSYNGYSKLETIKIKDALGREMEKQQAKELQLAK